MQSFPDIGEFVGDILRGYRLRGTTRACGDRSYKSPRIIEGDALRRIGFEFSRGVLNIKGEVARETSPPERLSRTLDTPGVRVSG